MWGGPIQNNPHKDLTTATVKHLLDQETKTELSRYYHAVLFIPTNTILLKASKQVFLNSCPGMSESSIIKHLGESINTTIGHLHMNRQGV